jgi:hypothetical protein
MPVAHFVHRHTFDGLHYCPRENDTGYVVSAFVGGAFAFHPAISSDINQPVPVYDMTDAFYRRCLTSSVDLPDWLTAICGQGGFTQPLGVAQVAIPAWVTALHPSAFSGLKSVTFSDGSQLREIGGFSHGKFASIAVPDSVEWMTRTGFSIFAA